MRTSAPLRQGCEVNYDASDLAGLETGGPIEVVSMPKGVNGHRVTSHYKLDMKTMEGKSALGLQLLGSPPPTHPLRALRCVLARQDLGIWRSCLGDSRDGGRGRPGEDGCVCVCWQSEAAACENLRESRGRRTLNKKTGGRRCRS